MEQYLLFVLLGIVVILIIKRSFSNYYPSTPVDDYTPKIYQDYLSKDVADPSGAYVIPGNPNDKNLTRLAINNFIWDPRGNVTINGTTYPTSSIWGYRKQLTIGGGGPMWYILTSHQIGGPDKTPPIIDTYVDPQTAIWAIPQFVLVRKSQVSPIIECATNAVYDASSLQCVCKAGYYGTGDPNATGGNPLGCNICPVGSYCLGGTSQTACPTGTSVQGAISQNACGVVCNPANPGGTRIDATTSSTAVCQCVAGYAGTGTTCGQCQLGTTYSSVDGAALCSPVTSCSTGYIFTTPATIIADNICLPFGPYTLTSTTYGTSVSPAGTAHGTLPNCSTSASTYYASPYGMNGIWVWKVPYTRTYRFVVTGATGGAPTNPPAGQPAIVTADCPINAGTYVYMIIGQTAAAAGTSGYGGGGTFVFIGSQTVFTSIGSLFTFGNISSVTSTGLAIIAAGGGGGGDRVADILSNASTTSSGNAGAYGTVSGQGGAGGTNGAGGSNGNGYGGSGICTLGSTNGGGITYNSANCRVIGGGGGTGTGCGGGGGYSGGGGGTRGANGGMYGPGGGGGSEVVAGTAVAGVRGQAVKVNVSIASNYLRTNGSVVIS
jgi:hypothetical protein